MHVIHFIQLSDQISKVKVATIAFNSQIGIKMYIILSNLLANVYDCPVLSCSIPRRTFQRRRGAETCSAGS